MQEGRDVGQIELIRMLQVYIQLIQGRIIHGQVIGNVCSIITLPSSIYPRCLDLNTAHSQFQQRKVGVAVVCPILALLRDIVLEDGGSFGIVSVQAVQDSIDMLWPVRCVIESDAHG